MMIHFAFPGLPSQSTGVLIMPKLSSIPLIMPLNDENMKKKIIPMIAVLVMLGKNKIVLKKFWPLIPVFSKTARKRESGI